MGKSTLIILFTALFLSGCSNTGAFLSANQTIEFMEEPHWYYIFETELLFTHLAKNAEKDLQSYFPLMGYSLVLNAFLKYLIYGPHYENP